jgi:hypothetical protein
VLAEVLIQDCPANNLCTIGLHKLISKFVHSEALYIECLCCLTTEGLLINFATFTLLSLEGKYSKGTEESPVELAIIESLFHDNFVSPYLITTTAHSAKCNHAHRLNSRCQVK